MELKDVRIQLQTAEEGRDAAAAAAIGGSLEGEQYSDLQPHELPAAMNDEVTAAAVRGFRKITRGEVASAPVSSHRAGRYLIDLGLEEKNTI
jgi:hypothetical protein